MNENDLIYGNSGARNGSKGDQDVRYDNSKSSSAEYPTFNSKGEKLSYFKGDTSYPLITLTMGQVVEQAACQYPDRIAISFFGGQKLSYAEVLDKADTLAAAYLNLGLRKGDHVAIWGFNSVNWYLSFLASFRAGLIVVNLNPLYQASELLTCLNIANVKALIMDERLEHRDFYDILAQAVPEIHEYPPSAHIKSDKVPSLNTVIIFSGQSYNGTFQWDYLFSLKNYLQRNLIKHIQSEIDPFDACNVQFTSGTTSLPKAVLLTHRGLINAAYVGGRHKGLRELRHKMCLQIPFFHVYGEVHGILTGLLYGNAVILPSTKFSPSKSIDCIVAEKCSIIYGTPTMYMDLLTVSLQRANTDPEIFDKMSSVSIFHCGGAICLPQILHQLKKYFSNSQFMSGYAMTETSGTCMASTLQDSDKVLQTVGRVLDHVEVKVVDNNGEIVPLGTPGELCCRGYLLMKGYYKDPKKTKAIITHDGWLHTGDRFVLMEDGYAQIIGRIKEIIIRGGENIQPKEIEELLIKHPDVDDVQVYGVRDPRLGDAVAAAIVKKTDSKLSKEDVQNYCKGVIASYKIPQYVTFVEKFPKTASGKVQKFKLKEITEKEINVESDNKYIQ